MNYDQLILPFNVSKIQGHKPWCEYYSIAAILNNLYGKQTITASELINQVNLTVSDEQFLDINRIIIKNRNFRKYNNQTHQLKI